MKYRKLASITIAALACAWVSIAQGPPKEPPPPPDVQYITVESKTVPVSFEYIGVTEASKVVEIRARVQGFVESRDFEEGMLVDTSKTLYTIDPRTFQADLDIAKAQLQQAEARVKLAEQDVKRLQSVTVPGAIAQSDLDKQIAEVANAKAAFNLAKAQVEKAELELSYTTVRAPVAGLIGKTEKEIGSMVDAGQNSLLTVLRVVDPIYVSFRVTERDFLAIQESKAKKTLTQIPGSEPYLEIKLLDGSIYEKHGKIDFESTSIDTQTGNVELRATFENTNRVLKPGQFVKAIIRGWERADTLTVPQRAVSQSPQGPYVFVVGNDNKAQLRIVKPGQWVGSDWIIEDGIKAGDKVVVEGIVKVQPGIVVNPSPFPKKPATPQAK